MSSPTREDHGPHDLVARSSARRLLVGLESIGEVVLDFSSVEWISPSFGDEILRVFATAHPEIKLVAINTNEPVDRMIRRALAAAKSQEGEPTRQ